MTNKTLKISTAALAVALAITACGGGGGSPGTVTGASTTTVGPITGFGSIFVNGVEFATPGTSISVNKASGDVLNLKVGMMVTVQGSVNANGTTGTASSIQFSDELEGAVISNSIVAGQSTGTLNIMGQRVGVTATTVFESAVAAVKSVDQIVAGNIVEVSGYSSGTGSIDATRIEVKAVNLASYLTSHDAIEVKGVVSGLDSNTSLFTLGGMVVDYSHATLDNMPTAGIANDLYVEVKSTAGIDPGTGHLIASEISVEGDGAPGVQGHDGEQLDIHGAISRDFDTVTATFDLNGTTVLVNADTELNGMRTADLKTGVVVEIEGHFNANRVLVASSIHGDSEADQELHGIVASISLDASSVNSGSVTLADNKIILVTNTTIMEDDRQSGGGPNETFNLSLLAAGDNIEVEVYTDNHGALVATKLKREDATSH